MKRFLTCLPIFLIAVGSQLASANAAVVNGSLTGPVANGGVPTGWTPVVDTTPDTNGISSNLGIPNYRFVGDNPPLSPDGGTWVSLASSGTYIEGFEQTLNDLDVGRTYNLSWYAGNFGVVLSGNLSLVEANAFEVLLDSVSIGSGANITLGSDWVLQSITFVASSTSQNLQFRLASGANSYLSIDGIELNSVPLPAALPLFLTVLGGMGFLGWRHKLKSA